jgi:hypothetical protein
MPSFLTGPVYIRPAGDNDREAGRWQSIRASLDNETAAPIVVKRVARNANVKLAVYVGGEMSPLELPGCRRK